MYDCLNMSDKVNKIEFQYSMDRIVVKMVSKRGIFLVHLFMSLLLTCVCFQISYVFHGLNKEFRNNM